MKHLAALALLALAACGGSDCGTIPLPEVGDRIQGVQLKSGQTQSFGRSLSDQRISKVEGCSVTTGGGVTVDWHEVGAVIK